MPVKGKSPVKPSQPKTNQKQMYYLANDAAWGGFINVRLDERQREEFHSWWSDNAQHSGEILAELIAAGLKVTLAYDPENDAWLCSLTGRLVHDSDDRFVTTTRASNLSEVIALAVWKHVYVQFGVYQRYSNNNKPLWG